ncbi:MAG: hypothetical protein WDO73_30520 [Ignavibacteriota bacterium]
MLQEQFGLKLENRKSQVEGIVVDNADRNPIGGGYRGGQRGPQSHSELS